MLTLHHTSSNGGLVQKGFRVPGTCLYTRTDTPATQHCSQTASLAFPRQGFSPVFFFAENKTKQTKTTSANRGNERFEHADEQLSVCVRRVQQLHRARCAFSMTCSSRQGDKSAQTFSACIYLANTRANESTRVRALSGKKLRDVHLNCSVVT